MQSITEIRAVPIKFDQINYKITFKSIFEYSEFILFSSEKIFNQLLNLINKEVDISILISRDENQNISEGNILEFKEINYCTPEQEIIIWKKWFAEVGSPWNNIENIEEELERNK